MQKQSAYTRELFAITEALAKFRHYLLGHKFVIKSDQKSLKSLLDQSLQTPEQQAWNVQEVNDYSVKDGLLYWKDWLVLPSQSQLIQTVLKENHSSPIGGHAGVTRTIARTTA
ncbi:disease resistance protein [Trifolium medium]|uniref:Disease resistance protein n=1 Tax=Trifolium medium TaxID=97028 RepID=A0A392QD48_9FABA|nr:disease resistance protein [Trifolium medium]